MTLSFVLITALGIRLVTPNGSCTCIEALFSNDRVKGFVMAKILI